MALANSHGHARRSRSAQIVSPAAKSAFGRWLTVTVEGIRTDSRRRRWSAQLSEAIDVDDAYLRRIAEGKQLPSRDVTFAIGEGLRKTGVTWCSGAMALLRNRAHRSHCYALLDIVSRSRPNGARMAREWYTGALMLEAMDRTKLLTEDAREIGLNWAHEKIERDDSIASDRLTVAWDYYLKHGIDRIHGYYGGIYLISSMEEFAPVADSFSDILEHRLLEEIRVEEENECSCKRSEFLQEIKL